MRLNFGFLTTLYLRAVALPMVSVMMLFMPDGVSGQTGSQRTTDLSNPLHLVADHATASVADLEKEEKWYVQVLGFREVNHIRRGTEFEACRVAVPGFNIDLVRQKGSKRSEKGAGNLEQGWLHVVFKSSAIDQAYAALTAAHADVKAERDPHGGIARLIVHDPEGNEIEIFAE